MGEDLFCENIFPSWKNFQQYRRYRKL